MKLLISLFLLGGLSDCATMSPQGRMVATGSPLAGVASQHSSHQNALNKALNETAKLGGTHLVFDAESIARFRGAHQTVRGKAYRK